MVCHECARLFNTGAQCFPAGLSPCKSSSMADPAICVISDQILCIDPHDSGLQCARQQIWQGGDDWGRSFLMMMRFMMMLRLPSTSTLPANTSWRPCTNRALMSEIQSIWVNFERKADSPNC